MNPELKELILQKTIESLKEDIGALHVSLAESQAKVFILEEAIKRTQEEAKAEEVKEKPKKSKS